MSFADTVYGFGAIMLLTFKELRPSSVRGLGV